MSSSETAISIRGLGKSYVIEHGPGPTNAREALGYRLRHPFARKTRETFWAIRDVDVDIAAGDVVGIIGRNGAGKSTLLKILSRITEPTEGAVDLFGRVGSLLEVGTGFHPELTGRENVYLNGAMLGMRKREITREFDAIVEFSGIGQFLDTPVKRYSTGMAVRLAFAVAAHLKPDILIVDEVLAVGDAEFQQKCLGKMRDVARAGRTVVFVSHNMAAVVSLCTRAVLLHKGRLVCNDSVDVCVRTYTSNDTYRSGPHWTRTAPLPTRLGITDVSVQLDGRQPDHTLLVEVKLQSTGRHLPAYVLLEITDAAGTVVLQALPTMEGYIRDTSSRHLVRFAVELPPLIPGQYLVTAWVGAHDFDHLDMIPECVGFEIDKHPTPGRTSPHTPNHGYVVPKTTLEYIPG